LRDIEDCLAANQVKWFRMGLGSSPARSTPSDALNQRDWRIYHAPALRPIAHARALYADEPASLDLDAGVYSGSAIQAPFPAVCKGHSLEENATGGLWFWGTTTVKPL
jgi:hypothetical protein